MKLKPDEISTALTALSDLLGHKGTVFVDATTETTEGPHARVRDAALRLDVADPHLFASFTVDVVHRGPADAPITPGLYPLAALAGHLTKGKKVPGALVRIRTPLTPEGVALRAVNAEGKEKVWSQVSRDPGDRPEAVRVPPTPRVRKLELPQVVADNPVPFDLGKDTFDTEAAVRAICIVRPAGVTVTHAPGRALVYEGRWFGVHFRIVLHEGGKGTR